MGAIKFGGATFTTGSNPTPKLFASGAYTSFADVGISSTYASHVSASITLTSTSDVKVLWSPSRTREEDSGRGLAYMSCSALTVANGPEWYLTRHGWSYQANSAGFQWIFADVPSGEQTFYVQIKKINGTVKMNRNAGADGVDQGRDVIYIETINR